MSNQEQNTENQKPENENLQTENTAENQNEGQEAGKATESQQEEPGTEEKLAAANDKYLRLSAEFDNYRKRTLKEKYDLIKTAGEDIIIDLLPIIDDFDRAMQAIADNDADNQAFKEGIVLIYEKMLRTLKGKGLTEIECKDQPFDTELHEAVSKFPMPDKKGIVIDVAQKGYKLNDKVIRYAKVIVGE